MAELMNREVESLTKTLWALSSRKMEAKAALKQAHRHEDPLGSKCLQLHHEASLAEANFNAAVAVVELIGWKARTDRDGRFTKLEHSGEPLEVVEVWDYWDAAKQKRVNLLRRFPNASKCKAWLMEGMSACEGAERDHYVDMLQRLEAGDRRLYYR